LVIIKRIKLGGSGEQMFLLPSEYRDRPENIKDIDIIVRNDSNGGITTDEGLKKLEAVYTLLRRILNKPIDDFYTNNEDLLSEILPYYEIDRRYLTIYKIVRPFGEIFTDIMNQEKDEERKRKLLRRLNKIIEAIKERPEIREDLLEAAAKSVIGRIKFVYPHNKRAARAMFDGLREEIEDAHHLNEEQKKILREVYRRAEKYL
jgi:hypothetical protein